MENYGQGSPLKNLRKTASIFMLAVAGIVFPAIVFIGCDNDTTSGDGNNNNNNQNALNIATLTEWVNDPARRVDMGGGGPAPFNNAIRSGFLAAAPGLWDATSGTYQNNHATYARMLRTWLESEGTPTPIIITKGKQFDASAISVKNPLGEYMHGQQRQCAA